MSELENCPFCGSKAKLFHDTSSDYERNWTWTAECTKCEADICCTKNRDDVIDKWNTRIIDQPYPCIQGTEDSRESWFEADDFIGELLLKGLIFTNSYWAQKDWPSDAKAKTALFINCSDTFAWGCADAEEIDYDEFDTLYEYYTKDPIWGCAIWCMTKRKELPQKPVYDDIIKKGIWNLDTMKCLEENYYDKVCKEQAELRKFKKDIGI